MLNGECMSTQAEKARHRDQEEFDAERGNTGGGNVPGEKREEGRAGA